MIKLSEKSRKALRFVYRGLGVTAVSLMFQACYGMPPAGDDVSITGVVKAKGTEQPVQGIQVTINNTSNSILTRADGNFTLYAPAQDSYTLKFEDIDGDNNGSFEEQTKVIALADAGTVNILLEDAE